MPHSSSKWKTAEKIFIEHQSASLLAQEAACETDKDNVPLSVNKLAQMASGKASKDLPSLIPFKALPLYKMLLRQNALASSGQARAASTPEDFRRYIGPYTLEILAEEDAIFILLSLNGKTAPAWLTLLTKEGEHLKLRLPVPINDKIQTGFSVADRETQKTLHLLKNPLTSLYLHP